MTHAVAQRSTVVDRTPVVVEGLGDRGPAGVIPENQPVIITIDGPAGTGKSSVARELAHRLGLDFLDTGAMYRAAAAIALDRRIALDDADAVVREVAAADLRFDWSADPPTILAHGQGMDRRIRDPGVTAIVSAVAAIVPLRRLMVTRQRQIGRQHPRLVTEGRDQGSVVFPDAPVKFYLDADPAVRAARRAAQLREAGQPADEAELLREIIGRDHSDSSRAEGPLRCPPEAIRIDTSRLAFEDVVQTLERLVHEKVAFA